jgi:hypothetical protein
MAWVIKEVPIECIVIAPHTHDDASISKAMGYAKLPRETAPAIDTVMKGDKYELANGHHRLVAAFIRGDKVIKISYWDSLGG